MTHIKPLIYSYLRIVFAVGLCAGLLIAGAACNDEPEGVNEEAAAPKAPLPGSEAVRPVSVTKKAFKVDAGKLDEHAQAYHKELAEVARTGKAPEPVVPAEMEDATLGMSAGGRKMVATRYGGGAAPAPMAMPQAAGPGRALGGRMGKADAKVGVTAGGMQDIGQARRFIKEGQIPAPEMISIEGFLSEHDIPLEGAPTGVGELYGSASVAWTRRYGQPEPEALVQIGFGLDLNLADFHRQPLNLSVVVDVSGSMKSGDKMQATRTALAKLVDQLDEKDRLSIVLFNHMAWILVKPQAVTDREALKKEIEKIQAGGSTNIEAGMDLGYKLVAANLSDKAQSPRVFLLTDACPNVGATGPHGFKPMMQGAAALGIGVGAFGVGIDFGQELAYQIFQVRGANYFYLEDAEKIAKVFDEEFDFMVTPVAYDVKIDLVPAKGAEIGDVLGVPDFKKEAGRAEIRIPTLFLSKRAGGGTTMIAVKLKPAGTSERSKIADLELVFVTAETSELVTQKLEAVLPGNVDATGKTPYYSQPGAKKATVLADAAVALRAACRGVKAPTAHDLYWNLPPEAALLKGAGGRAPMALPGPTATLDAKSAGEAAEGLGRFADWLASQIGDIPGAEPELRLIEKLEDTLRSTAGLDPVPARTVPGTAVLTAPPEPF